MNPRVLLWLRSRGLTLDDITRRSGEDIPLVEIEDGRRIPWTIEYSIWITGKWEEWGKSLGFHADSWNKASFNALQVFTDEDFDLWLAKTVKGETHD